MEGHKFYPEEELAELIRGLDRAEDQHVFAEDVLVTYPYLAEQYTKLCPTRCDLATAARKALDGAYSQDAKLHELREDIALMVRNCVRFNGESHPLAEIAEAFEHFAMAQIDAYILRKTGGRRVSSLRLQSSLSQTSEEGNNTSRRSAAAAVTSNNAGHIGSNHGSAARGHGTKTAHAAVVRLPTRKELVDLVQSLIRREDAGAFSVDVAEAYPELRESYAAVCPRQMNLTRMKERAAQGYYLHEDDDRDRATGGAPSAEKKKEEKEEQEEDKGDADKQHALETKAEIDGEATAAREDNVANTTTTATAPQESATAHATQVFGDTVASSLLRLREDIELIVSNCIRFNAQVEAWIKLAQSFHRFAHRKVDEFVVRHAARLRGTQSGVDHYVRAASAPVNVLIASTIMAHHTPAQAQGQQQQQQEQQEGEAAQDTASAEAQPVASETTTSAAPSRKRGRDAQAEKETRTTTAAAATKTAAVEAPASTGSVTSAIPVKAATAVAAPPPPPPVEVVADMEPTIRPTPLQPGLVIPPSLRRRLVADHVGRERLRLRRLGQRYPLAELIGQDTASERRADSEKAETEKAASADALPASDITAAPSTDNTDDHKDDNTTSSHAEEQTSATAGAALIDRVGDIQEGQDMKAHAPTPPTTTTTMTVCVTKECTVSMVLEHFVQAIGDFYAAQRSRPDFDDPFRYAVHDEQMYYDLVRLIRGQFNRLFLPLLLYPREAADAHAWAAERTIHGAVQPQDSHSDEVDHTTCEGDAERTGAEDAAGVEDWAAEVHYCYLVRLLAQFPQLASLCCASPVAASAGGASSGSRDYVLKISKEALVLLLQVTKVTSELLQFVADYEARLTSTTASAAAPVEA